jgi:hypothetical protein
MTRGAVLTAAAAVLGLGVVVGIVALRPTGEGRPDVEVIGLSGPTYEAHVRAVAEDPCAGTAEADDIRCRRVTLALLEGPDEGTETTIDFPVSATSVHLEVGERVVLVHQEDAEPGFEYVFHDRARQPVLLWLALLFAAVVAALGRWRGVAALAGLAVSLAVLLAFVLPAILDGRPPVLVAVVGATGSPTGPRSRSSARSPGWR